MTDLSDDREIELYSRVSEAVTEYIEFMAARAGITGVQETYDHTLPIYETIMDTLVRETD